MIDLEPCPFCGSPAWFNYNMDLEPDGIRCDNCRYVIRFTRIRQRSGEKFEMTMQRLAEAWNRRQGGSDG